MGPSPHFGHHWLDLLIISFFTDYRDFSEISLQKCIFKVHEFLVFFLPTLRDQLHVCDKKANRYLWWKDTNERPSVGRQWRPSVRNDLLDWPASGNKLKSQWLQSNYHKHCTYFHGAKSNIQVRLVCSLVSVFDQLLSKGEEREREKTFRTHLTEFHGQWE